MGIKTDDGREERKTAGIFIPDFALGESEDPSMTRVVISVNKKDAEVLFADYPVLVTLSWRFRVKRNSGGTDGTKQG